MPKPLSELPWEKTVNGLVARKSLISKARPQIYGRAMGIAIRKMQDVDYIGATFSEYNCFFEPLVVTFILHGRPETFAECFGVYVPTVEHEGIPTFCVRKAIWHLQPDQDDYFQAKSKKLYLEGGQHIDAVSIFLSTDHSVELRDLIVQLGHLAEEGFSAKHQRREDHSWFNLNVKATSDVIDFDISYHPFTTSIQSLELWLTRWRAFFLQTDFERGILPDRDFTITYSNSFEEQIQSFPL